MRTLLSLILCLMLAGCVFDSRTMKFKFPSSGQSIDDAAVITQTLLGNSLKPLPPTNLRGSRDSAGSLLIEWERAARLGPGLRPYSDVPLAEERENYLVEIYNGSTLLRSMSVIVGVAQAVVWERYFTSDSKYQHIDQHTLSATGALLDVRAKALQQLTQTGAFVEGTLNASGDGTATLQLLSNDLSNQYSISVVPTTTSIYVNIGAGSDVYVADYSAGNDAVLRIVVSGSEVRFYKDYRGPGTAPLYVSEIAPSFPLIPGAQLGSGSGGTVSVSKVYMSTSNPKTIYSANQQTEDFGSTQSSIKVRVYQISALVGPGHYAEATL